MSWQAMEAVQDHSELNKQEQYSGLLIMLAIARFCDASGVSGRTRATAVSTEVIAEKAHVTKRTVLNWLPQLESLGELSVERNGMGRGKWNIYTINLPMPVIGESIGERIGESQGSPITVQPVDNSAIGESIGERIGESQGSPITLEALALMVNETRLLVNRLVKNGEPWGSPDTEIDTDLDTEKQKNIYIPGSHRNQRRHPPPRIPSGAGSGICYGLWNCLQNAISVWSRAEAYHEAAYYLHGEDAEQGGHSSFWRVVV